MTSREEEHRTGHRSAHDEGEIDEATNGIDLVELWPTPLLEEHARHKVGHIHHCQKRLNQESKEVPVVA